MCYTIKSNIPSEGRIVKNQSEKKHLHLSSGESIFTSTVGHIFYEAVLDVFSKPHFIILDWIQLRTLASVVDF